MVASAQIDAMPVVGEGPVALRLRGFPRVCLFRFPYEAFLDHAG